MCWKAAELLPSPGPTQGAHPPRASWNGTLTLVQLQLCVLSPALSTNSVDVDVSSQCSSLPCRGKDRKEPVIARLVRGVSSPAGKVHPYRSSCQSSVHLLFCLLFCFVVFIMLTYRRFHSTEKGNRREMGTTGLLATKHCLLNLLYLPTFGYQLLEFLAEIFAKLPPPQCGQGLRT